MNEIDILIMFIQSVNLKKMSNFRSSAVILYVVFLYIDELD